MMGKGNVLEIPVVDAVVAQVLHSEHRLGIQPKALASRCCHWVKNNQRTKALLQRLVPRSGHTD